MTDDYRRTLSSSINTDMMRLSTQKRGDVRMERLDNYIKEYANPQSIPPKPLVEGLRALLPHDDTPGVWGCLDRTRSRLVFGLHAEMQRPYLDKEQFRTAEESIEWLRTRLHGGQDAPASADKLDAEWTLVPICERVSRLGEFADALSPSSSAPPAARRITVRTCGFCFRTSPRLGASPGS